MLEKVFAAGYRWNDFIIIPAARQILRMGEPVEHEAKVFDLIVLLLEHHERALGKQEIITALWGNRPVTDAALSQLVYKARRALDDDGRSVIRTVYGRGLQWVAPIEALDEFTPPAFPDLATRHEAAPEDAAAPAAAGSGGPARPRRGKAAALTLGGLLLLLAGVVALWMWLGEAAPTLQPPDVAVIPIENATGDSDLDWTRLGLAALLTTELQRLGVNGTDTGQVERLVAQAPAAHRDAMANVREGSGARALVSGRLRRVGGLLRLELRLEQPGHGADLNVSGSAPAQLAVDLAAQLAARLHPHASARTASMGGRAPWLAETYARGMDLAARSEWLLARPFFELCVQQDPAFAEARLNLARMQARTGEEEEAGRNFQSLIAGSDANAPDTLRARMELAMLGADAGDRADAARALEELREPVARSGIATLPAWVEMNLAALYSELGQFREAEAALAEAEAIIRAHRLRTYEPRLHNVASLVAEARRDLSAAREANARALASARSLGDRQAALGSALNVAALDLADGRPLRALPLLVQSWRDAGELKAMDERLFAGQTLAEAVLQLGAAEAAEPLLARLRELAAGRGPRWSGVQQAVDGVALRLAGQPAAALESLTAARSTLRAAGLVALLPPLLDEQALALWDLGDAKALDALVAEVRGLTADLGELPRLEFSTRFIAALAAAKHGDSQSALVHVKEASRNSAAHGAATRATWRVVRLRIAQHEDDGAAEDACRPADLSTIENAEVLALCRRSVIGGSAEQATIQARLDQLRRAAVEALADLDQGSDARR